MHDDRRAALQLGLREHHARPESPRVHQRERGRRADDAAEIAPARSLHRRPVGDAGREVHDSLDLTGDRLRIIRRQRLRRTEPRRDSQLVATASVVAGADIDDVRAGRFDVGFHAGLRAIPQRDHRHHCADADDQAEHGQEGPQLVAAKGSAMRFENQWCSASTSYLTQRVDGIESRGLARRIKAEEDADTRGYAGRDGDARG